MERNSIIAPHAKVEPESSISEKIKEVLQLVQKDGPLTKKQLEFCDDPCVERYLKARANNVRRTARMLKATLTWRDRINIGYLIADEFPAELAAGAAYVAGHDDEGRPVLVIKKKPDYIINHTQKHGSGRGCEACQWGHEFAFQSFQWTCGVAAMPPGVDQWILILDAGGYSRVSAPSPSGILTTLKILSDHYPERLAKAFIVDASSMFYYVWKGICTFVDHSTRGKLSFAYLRDYRTIPRPPQTSKGTPRSSPSTNSSQRRSNFCFDDIKPPSYSATPGPGESGLAPSYDASPKKLDKEDMTDGPELISSVRTRSFSFSSLTIPTSYSQEEPQEEEFSSFRKDEPIPAQPEEVPGSAPARTKRSKNASWDGVFSIFYSQKKDEGSLLEEQRNRNVDLFRPYLKFLQAPYDEAAYRAMMKPPLGGLATIISRDLKRMNSF